VHEEVKSFLDATLLEQQTPRPKGAMRSPAAAALASLETVEKE
jgi:hypothetical protein